MAHALQLYFRSLHATGSTAARSGPMMDFTGLNQVLGTEDILRQGQAYAPERFEG